MDRLPFKANDTQRELVSGQEKPNFVVVCRQTLEPDKRWFEHSAMSKLVDPYHATSMKTQGFTPKDVDSDQC